VLPWRVATTVDAALVGVATAALEVKLLAFTAAKLAL
jgi:hypothetical protein